MNDQVLVKIKAWHRLVALATKPSTQRRDWQKDGFKRRRNLFYSVLSGECGVNIVVEFAYANYNLMSLVERQNSFLLSALLPDLLIR